MGQTRHYKGNQKILWVWWTWKYIIIKLMGYSESNIRREFIVINACIKKKKYLK